MGTINVLISGDLLKKALDLNTSDYGNVDIVNIHKDPTRYDTIILTLSNDKFPEVSEAEIIPLASPIIRKETTKIIDWGIYYK